MEIGHIIPHIEALIFASDRPLPPMEITELINNAFGFMEDKITLEQVQSAVEGIVEKYGSEFYPFELRESGGGYQFLTKKEFHKTVAQLNGDKFLKRLSPAALETLAIIAYKQPITKGEIESIRGVSCDYSIQKLLEKELIMITGRNEDMPGKPLVYVTSKTFMDYFGLNSPDELPKLREIFDETSVDPTSVTEDGQALYKQEDISEDQQDESKNFIVTEDGELLEAEINEGEESQEDELKEEESSQFVFESTNSEATESDFSEDVNVEKGSEQEPEVEFEKPEVSEENSEEEDSLEETTDENPDQEFEEEDSSEEEEKDSPETDEDNKPSGA
ncbi:MAG: SMC-Scp complex subunit ScpB [Flavitalea sp.]